MHRSETRILTTHAGSLPRPPALTQRRRARGQSAGVEPPPSARSSSVMRAR